jgi:hypothetical protein
MGIGMEPAYSGDSTSFNPLNVTVKAIDSSVPVGSIVAFHGTSAPDGFLECNGQTFNRTTYPKLYAVLNKATTPDMRGLFVRGFDPNGIHDSDGIGRVIGTQQGDAIRNITGSFIADIVNPSFAGMGTDGAFRDEGPVGPGDSTERLNELLQYSFDASRVVPVANENRPKNINLLYCIKHD